MLKITNESTLASVCCLKLEGWLSGPDVKTLEASGRRAISSGKGLVLDLTGLRYMDQDGIQLLESWAERDLQLIGVSSFFKLLLESNGLGRVIALDGEASKSG